MRNEGYGDMTFIMALALYACFHLVGVLIDASARETNYQLQLEEELQADRQEGNQL